MKAITEVPATGPRRGVMRRLGWFVLLWALGVASVGLVSLLLRAWIAP